MHSLISRLALASVALALVALPFACRSRNATAADCDRVLDHYVTLMFAEEAKDASPKELDELKSSVRERAKTELGPGVCEHDITPERRDCALRATTTDAVEKCME